MGYAQIGHTPLGGFATLLGQALGPRAWKVIPSEFRTAYLPAGTSTIRIASTVSAVTEIEAAAGIDQTRLSQVVEPAHQLIV